MGKLGGHLTMTLPLQKSLGDSLGAGPDGRPWQKKLVFGNFFGYFLEKTAFFVL
jgi:hypothetical protein